VLKRLLILGIAGIAFVLGANYLLVYTLNQQVKRHRNPQDESYWSAYTAIVQFGQHPDGASEQKAKSALDEASRKGVSKTREKFCKITLKTSSAATKAGAIPASRQTPI